MHRKHRHPMTSTNTPWVNALLRLFRLVWLEIYNSRGRLIIDPMEIPKKLKMTFRIQKNRQNGQSITLVADDTHHDICPVRAAHCIFLRAKKLSQSNSEPMGMFVNKIGIKKTHRRQDCQGIMSHCKESPSGPIRRRIKPHLFALRQSLGLRATGRSWNEPSLHDVSTTLDGRFLQAISVRHLNPAAQTCNCP